jgi:AcrR family transcriptional regulator
MLAAATELFTTHGYANVSMDAIADATGITKPLIYSYFGSKEGLYAGCIRRFLAPLEQAIGAVADPDKPPEQRMRNGALVVFEFVGAHLVEWKRFFLEPAAHGEEAAAAVHDLREHAIDQLSELFRQAMRDSGLPKSLETEIRYQVYIFAGGVEALTRWWVDHPDEATAELLALRVLNQAWLGFGNLLEGKLLS